MRCLIAIGLLAIACFAQQQYGVMSVCTHVDGKEYCFLSPGEYRAVEMDGTTVVAMGFNVQRYVSVGKVTSITNKSGTSVRFWQADDEYGNRFLLHSSRDNLFISDTTGCATVKYVSGGPGMLRKLYRFEETGSLDDQMGLIVQCREAKKENR